MSAAQRAIAETALADALDVARKVFKPETRLFILAVHPTAPGAHIMMCTKGVGMSELREAVDVLTDDERFETTVSIPEGRDRAGVLGVFQEAFGMSASTSEE